MKRKGLWGREAERKKHSVDKLIDVAAKRVARSKRARLAGVGKAGSQRYKAGSRSERLKAAANIALKQDKKGRIFPASQVGAFQAFVSDVLRANSAANLANRKLSAMDLKRMALSKEVYLKTGLIPEEIVSFVFSTFEIDERINKRSKDFYRKGKKK